jgi:hypothetical protein
VLIVNPTEELVLEAVASKVERTVRGEKVS